MLRLPCRSSHVWRRASLRATAHASDHRHVIGIATMCAHRLRRPRPRRSGTGRRPRRARPLGRRRSSDSPPTAAAAPLGTLTAQARTHALGFSRPIGFSAAACAAASEAPAVHSGRRGMRCTVAQMRTSCGSMPATVTSATAALASAAALLERTWVGLVGGAELHRSNRTQPAALLIADTCCSLTAARSLMMPIRVNKGTDNANKGTDNANKG